MYAPAALTQLEDKLVDKLWKYRGKVDGVENLLWSRE